MMKRISIAGISIVVIALVVLLGDILFGPQTTRNLKRPSLAQYYKEADLLDPASLPTRVSCQQGRGASVKGFDCGSETFKEVEEVQCAFLMRGWQPGVRQGQEFLPLAARVRRYESFVTRLASTQQEAANKLLQELKNRLEVESLVCKKLPFPPMRSESDEEKGLLGSNSSLLEGIKAQPGAQVYAVARRENLVFAAAGYEGLVIEDISDPASPQIVSVLDTPGKAVDIVLKGNTAYLADSYGGVEVIDITKVRSPILLGTHQAAGPAVSISYYENRLYVATKEDGLHVLDILESVIPDEVGHFDTRGRAQGSTIAEVMLPLPETSSSNGPAFEERLYAYVADGSRGISVVDVTPQDMRGYLPDAGITTAGPARAVASKFGVLFAALGKGGVAAFDIERPNRPVLIAEYDTAGKATDIALASNGLRVYVADGEEGVVSLAPELDTVRVFDTAGKAIGLAPPLGVDDSWITVADYYGGLLMIEE